MHAVLRRGSLPQAALPAQGVPRIAAQLCPTGAAGDSLSEGMDMDEVVAAVGKLRYGCMMGPDGLRGFKIHC